MISKKILFVGEGHYSSKFSQVVTLRVIVTLLLLIPVTESEAQERWHASLSGGIASPEFLGSDSPGYTMSGTIYYDMWDTTQLSVSVGYSKWKENLGPGGTHFRSFPLLVGVRQPFPMGWGTPYVSGEVGLHVLRRDYTYEIYEQPNPPFYQLVSSTPASESVTKLAYRWSAGVTIVLRTELELDLGMHYHRVDYGYVYRYPQGIGKISLNLYGVSAGVRYNIR